MKEQFLKAESPTNALQSITCALKKFGLDNIIVIQSTNTPDTYYIPARNLPKGFGMMNVTLLLCEALGDGFEAVYGAGNAGIETEQGIIDFEVIVITVRS